MKKSLNCEHHLNQLLTQYIGRYGSKEVDEHTRNLIRFAFQEGWDKAGESHYEHGQDNVRSDVLKALGLNKNKIAEEAVPIMVRLLAKTNPTFRILLQESDTVGAEQSSQGNISLDPSGRVRSY